MRGDPGVAADGENPIEKVGKAISDAVDNVASPKKDDAN